MGRTYRNFDITMNEHKQTSFNKNRNSHYANHLKDEKYNFDMNFDILYTVNKSNKLKLLEALEIIT